MQKLRIVTNLTASTNDLSVLLIRLSALGDVVHTLPAAYRLKEKRPDAKLTWVVEAPFAELLQNNPAVDDVIIFPKKTLAQELSNPIRWLSPSCNLKRFRDELKSRKFNVAVDFQGLFKSGAIAWMSGAPIRIGFSEGREFSDLLMTHKLDVGDYFSFDMHVVDHNLALAEFLLRITGGADQEFDGVKFPLPIPAEENVRRMFSLVGSGHESMRCASPQQDSSDTSTSRASDVLTQPHTESNTASGVEPHLESDHSATDSSVISQAGAGETGDANVILPQPERQAPDAIRPPRVEPRLETHAVSVTSGGGHAATPANEAPIVPTSSSPAQKTDDEVRTASGVASIGERQEDSSGHEPLVVLIPGTTWATKIWPREKWAELARLLLDIRDVRIVLIGGAAESEMNRYIYDRVLQNKSLSGRILDATGNTSLLDLVALFMMADIVVGADTGPLHMAAATEHPYVIGVYGSTPWKRNGPYGERSSIVALRLSCQPCFEKRCPLETIACLKDLQPSQVLYEIKRAAGALLG